MICTKSGLSAVVNALTGLAAALAFRCAAFRFLLALVVGVSSEFTVRIDTLPLALTWRRGPSTHRWWWLSWSSSFWHEECIKV